MWLFSISFHFYCLCVSVCLCVHLPVCISVEVVNITVTVLWFFNLSLNFNIMHSAILWSIFMDTKWKKVTNAANVIKRMKVKHFRWWGFERKTFQFFVFKKMAFVTFSHYLSIISYDTWWVIFHDSYTASVWRNSLPTLYFKHACCFTFSVYQKLIKTVQSTWKIFGNSLFWGLSPNFKKLSAHLFIWFNSIAFYSPIGYLLLYSSWNLQKNLPMS